MDWYGRMLTRGRMILDTFVKLCRGSYSPHKCPTHVFWWTDWPKKKCVPSALRLIPLQWFWFLLFPSPPLPTALLGSCCLVLTSLSSESWVSTSSLTMNLLKYLRVSLKSWPSFLKTYTLSFLVFTLKYYECIHSIIWKYLLGTLCVQASQAKPWPPRTVWQLIMIQLRFPTITPLQWLFLCYQWLPKSQTQGTLFCLQFTWLLSLSVSVFHTC